MSDETSNLVAESSGGNNGHFGDDFLVNVEISAKTSVVFLDKHSRGFLDSFGANTTLKELKLKMLQTSNAISAASKMGMHKCREQNVEVQTVPV